MSFSFPLIFSFFLSLLFYSPFSIFLIRSTLLLLYPFLFPFSILLQRYRSHLCSVPSVFSCTYKILDVDNNVMNYLYYLIPHTIKSVIFPHASIQIGLINSHIYLQVSVLYTLSQRLLLVWNYLHTHIIVNLR